MATPRDPNDPRKDRVIRDPVHDYINLPIELNSLVDEPLVQRLRYVGQTAMASTVFPAMSGSRFEHALGTMHLAQEAWAAIRSRSNRVFVEQLQREMFWFLESKQAVLSATDFEREQIKSMQIFQLSFDHTVSLALAAVGLLHDLGHPPFSHALEDFYDRNLDLVMTGEYWKTDAPPIDFLRSRTMLPFHERAGELMLTQIPTAITNELPWNIVVEVLASNPTEEGWASALHSIVASEVDVDRLDYMIRDARRSGTEFGAVDVTRIVQSFELHDVTVEGGPEVAHKFRIGVGLRARSAVETLLSNRLRYYQWVLFHPHVAAANQFLDLALQELVDVCAIQAREDNADHNDKELSRLLFRAMPSLNYVYPQIQLPRTRLPIRAEPNEAIKDPDQTRRQAAVDDSTIRVWLKTSASHARAAIAEADISRPLDKRLRRFIAFVDAVEMRDLNWAPVWKTEDDFASIAERAREGVMGAVSEKIEAISRQVSTGDLQPYLSPQLKVLKAIAEDLTQSSSANDDHEADKERDRHSAVEGVNLLFRRLLHASEPLQNFRRRTMLAAAFNRATDLNQTVGTGTWVFAYSQVSALRADERGIALWDLNAPHSLRSVSSMARALPDVAKGFPQVFAYYVAYDGKAMREDRRSMFGTTLQEAFVKALPDVVIEMAYTIFGSTNRHA